MKRGCLAVLLLLTSTCGRGSKGISGAAYQQAGKAAAAIQRANEYRDETREFYEPRLLDAQRAVDEMPHDQMVSWGTIQPEWKVADQARICLTELKTYRLILVQRAYALEAVERGRRDGAADLKEAKSKAIDQGFRVEGCLAELRSYLR